MAEKLRVHQLAKELGVDSKAILTKCEAEGLEVKNHMTTLSAGLAATIREWFSESAIHNTLETAEPVDLEQVRRKSSRRRRKEDAGDTSVATEIATDLQDIPDTHDQPETHDDQYLPDEAESLLPEETDEMYTTPETHEPAVAVAEAPTDITLPTPVNEPPPATPLLQPPVGVVELPKAAPVAPVGPQHVPRPVQLKGPRVIRVEAPEPESQRPRRPAPAVGGPPRPRLGGAVAGTEPMLGDASTKSGAGKKNRSKTYQSEDAEAAETRRRAAARKGRGGTDVTDKLKEWRDLDLAERQERLRGATGRRMKRRATEGRSSLAPRSITEAEVTEPIILKDFCAATGLALTQLTPKLVNDFKILPNINMVLDREMAQLLANEFGIDLHVVAARNPLDDMREKFRNRPRPNIDRRAPVVTFLGHVDHGKTSLLDAIRQTHVATGEAGGITQHIGSYHVRRDGLAVTFMDTPGHQAFTAMRARGAQMTDVVVLVVAADDGVMPQTVEAINHAKAAKVPIVVAMNKIDLPGVDLNKIYGQLSEQGLTPSEWGGTIDVIKTSATKGIGINELVEHLSTLSDILELRADPTVPAFGRVIEAQMRPGVGVVARILIQEGTLLRGQFIVCGPGYGKVRSIKDDKNQELNSAGPSLPVEISGLDELPGAGDELFVVDSLQQAETVAEQVKQEVRRKSLSAINKPKTLEDLFDQRQAGEIPELNVILKADMQGSVDVLRKALGEIPSSEVKLNILHSGVGGVVDGDVLLAEASGAIIIGFQVVADTSVKRLAEDRGVDIRLYRVIYNVLDDIKKALEGLLAPEEKLETRGQAEVRDIFRITRVGTVAGCFVREGFILRNHRVRIIRDRVIIRDECTLHSLKRFKDDVREVKSGYECGIKIDGFDDVKPGDIIESYEVVKIARTL
ncbi:MAG: Elongation factor 4 [Phycisphaerae bacterium]|nr:Elongation factor 4 [Phycisphaerae bacterium]